MTITTDNGIAKNSLSRDFVADLTVERDHRPILNGPNKFKLAMFGANVSTGQGGLTLADNMIKLGNWDEVKGLAAKADRYGVDGFIPIARWQGISGPERPWGRQFETLTWAAGLAAATDRIQIFATCHMPFVHPVMAAKMVATIDHISGGRMGLNAVAGYHRPEYRMFGLDVPPHDERYKLAEEWMTIVERLWADEEYEFDFEGDYFSLEGAQGYPKPVQSPGPVVMSAGSSPAGQQFAFRHANVLFAGVPDVDGSESVAAPIRKKADEAGREDLALWAGVHIVCKDTEKEARDYVKYIEEKGDWESAARFLSVVESGDVRSVDYYKGPDAKRNETVRSLFRAGLVPLVGTPEMIVDGFQKLSNAGIVGTCVGMVDYDEGLDRFYEQIFPLMCSAGLRA